MPLETDSARADDVRWAVGDIKDRATVINLYRAYYDGDHRMPWATARWQSDFRDLFERFRDNLCPAIVDAKADRIQLTNVASGEPTRPDTRGGETPPPNPVDEAISRIWTREKLEARQGEIHKNSLKDGDAFVIVWPDEVNQARWYVQRGDRMAARYAAQPQGDLEVAGKLWPVQETSSDGKSFWRLNLYYPDRIERYITIDRRPGADVESNPAKWDEFVPDDELTVEGEEKGADDELLPGPTYVVQNPYGVVPVFPFPNNSDLGAYGRSELKDVIPIQDALNKSVANMLVAGEFVAWPQRYLIGVEVDVDESGTPTGIEQKSALDRILAIANPNAKAGEFSGANLEGFIKEQDSYRAEMARISRTPLHYLLLSGEFPSGEALGAAERPLMAQVDDRIVTLRLPWQAAMSFSLRIEQAEHDPAGLNAIFKDTRYKSPESSAEEMRVKKELGIPDEQLWREMGYDEEQIREFAELKQERTLSMQAAFDTGTPDVINPEAEPAGPPA